MTTERLYAAAVLAVIFSTSGAFAAGSKVYTGAGPSEAVAREIEQRLVDVFYPPASWVRCSGIKYDDATVVTALSCGAGKDRIFTQTAAGAPYEFVEASKGKGFVVFRAKPGTLTPKLPKLRIGRACAGDEVTAYVKDKGDFQIHKGVVTKACDKADPAGLITTSLTETLPPGTGLWSNDGALVGVYTQGFWRPEVVPAEVVLNKDAGRTGPLLQEGRATNPEIQVVLSPMLEYRQVPETRSGTDLGLSLGVRFASERPWDVKVVGFQTFLQPSAGYAVFLGSKWSEPQVFGSGWYGAVGLGQRWLKTLDRDDGAGRQVNEVSFKLGKGWLGLSASLLVGKKTGYAIQLLSP